MNINESARAIWTFESEHNKERLFKFRVTVTVGSLVGLFPGAIGALILDCENAMKQDPMKSPDESEQELESMVSA